MSKAWWERLGAIGDRPGDTAEERLRHRFLVFLGLMMSVGGLIWGTLSVVFDQYLQSIIPFGYTFVTALNLLAFRMWKNFRVVRFVQVLISLVLPFLFQWGLGGFYSSGAVMLWAMIAIVGSLTFTGPRDVIKWLFVYSALTIVSAIIDADMRARFDIGVGDGVVVAFFTINIVIISNIVFGLMIYLIFQRQRIADELAAATQQIEGLQEEVEEARKLGQYTLEHKLGEGGMGVVYRASHALLRRPTAIKLLPPDRVGEASVRRFEREVQLTAKLTHPNTITIFDYGRTPDGVFYYAMELLDGANLDDVVEVGGPQGAPRVRHVLQQMAGALAEAHALDLIHRDIKPANVFLCQQGGLLDQTKLLDFGLVKRVTTEKAGSGLTHDNAVAGTPAYLAPEAFTDPDNVNHRADIYALGCVGFFLLTGEDLFSGRTPIEVCGHHLHTPPDLPSDRLGSPLPHALEHIIMDCLRKDPEARPESAEVIADRLAAVDVPAWTRQDALAWWDEYGERIEANRGEASESGRTIVVDVGRRGDPRRAMADTPFIDGDVTSPAVPAETREIRRPAKETLPGDDEVA